MPTAMKVLIISHNPLCDYNNMGKTLASLFSCFRKEELCQLYIHPSVPNIDVCNSYFRIRDSDMMKRLLPVRTAPGHEVRCEAGATWSGQGTKKSRSGEQPFRRLCRELVWCSGAWDSPALHAWLDREKPSIIFAAPGNACFLYGMAMAVSKKYRIPIVTYLCDDFYYKRVGSNPFTAIRYRVLRHKFRQLLAGSVCAVTICEEYTRRLAEDFRIRVETVMTGIRTVASAMKKTDEVRNIVYAGNIGWGRYASITEFGKALDAYNHANGKTVRLKVYSGETNPKALRAFDTVESLDFCGYVGGDAYKKAILEADALLFAESFHFRDMEATRYSISTKIPEYLASGIPIIAYAPSEISSVKYLKSKRCAVCFDSQPLSLSRLNEKVSRQSVARRQLAVAARNHNARHNSARLSCLLHSFAGSGERS